jgi:1-pyrroline-5-carboxylate dehydrogenase
VHWAGAAETQQAIDSALAASAWWGRLPWEERVAPFLRAADMLEYGPWRDKLNAATMLELSKTTYQADIDAACETLDFIRANVKNMLDMYDVQPTSRPGEWNSAEYRPLEGFVFAVTPFNFTCMNNLAFGPAVLGNTVVWKPAESASLVAHLSLELLREAGLPDGVVNIVYGDGAEIGEVALNHRDLAAVHFTGSTATFQHIWRTVGANVANYKNYPRVVGETGGKGFVIAHPSADVEVLRTALVRGAFEYQGQKCSAASRAYVPRSVWRRLESDFLAEVDALPMGDVSDFGNFMGAVIYDGAFERLSTAIQRARTTAGLAVVAGGGCDDSVGWFVRPTVVIGDDPTDEVFVREYFGPLLAVHVYDDDRYDAVLAQAADVAPYALTGAIIAQDRAVVAAATESLRFSAGNFYVNDKPTGAVVGQQPFGGSRASGTNDKAGSAQNLLRWTSTRALKETFVPATSSRYPHMDTDAASAEQQSATGDTL